MDESSQRPYHHGSLKEMLIRLALEHIETHELRSLSLRDLAHQAGVSKTAPYRHFADRDELVRTLIEIGMSDLAKSLETVLESSIDPRTGLRTMGKAYLRFALARPGMYRLFFSEDAKRIYGECTYPLDDRAFQALVGMIRECQSSGWMPDADPLRLSLTYWSLVHGAADLALKGVVRPPEGIDPLEFWGNVVDFVPNEPQACRERPDRKSRMTI